MNSSCAWIRVWRKPPPKNANQSLTHSLPGPTLNCKHSPGKLFLVTVEDSLRDLAFRPAEYLVKRWNWKAAFSSSLIRALIFFIANLGSGLRAATGAMLAEYFYRAVTSGFYGAMTQHISEAEPEWQAAVCAMILLPLSSHTFEFLIHWLRHTPHLKASIIASMSFTVVSTLFNFYAMRRGTMTVGRNAASIGDDLRALPRVIAGFLCAGPLWAWRVLR